MKTIRDEIRTDDTECALMLQRLHREFGRIPNNGHMWRVINIKEEGLTSGPIYGGKFDRNPKPAIYLAPLPSSWVFSLERDA